MIAIQSRSQRHVVAVHRRQQTKISAIRRKKARHCMAAAPLSSSAAAADSSEPESQCQIQSLRDFTSSSTLLSVNCYGVNRCIIQARASDGQPMLVACQQTLKIDDDAASALLRDAGKCCVAALFGVFALFFCCLTQRAAKVYSAHSLCSTGSTQSGGQRCV